MRRLAEIFLLVWAFVPVQPARGADDTARLAYFLPIARAQWPGSRCSGVENVQVNADAAVDALNVTYNDDAIAWAWPRTCSVVMVSGLSNYGFCAVVVHELGHLAGYQHSTDPKSIMYPTVPSGYAPCVAAAWPGYLARRPHRKLRSGS